MNYASFWYKNFGSKQFTLAQVTAMPTLAPNGEFV